MRGRIAVVGAGVGGLASAARLSHRGYNVEVFEKLSECGGRAHIIQDKGFLFDTGPSFVLMPDFFAEVFQDCGKNIADYLDLKTLDTGYKIFYPDGEVLSIYRDKEKTKDELERIEHGSAAAYEKLLSEIEVIYKAVKPLLYKCFPPYSLFNPAYLPLVTKIKVGETYWRLVKKFFRSEKLCYAFTFEAMFIGVSPFVTPALYSIITYTDHVQKIAHPMGGMYQIPLSLEKICRKQGVKFRYNCEVQGVEGCGKGVVLSVSPGEERFDQAVVNADYPYAQSTLLKRSIPRYQYSCSTYLIYLGTKRRVNNLAHHNLFFATDLRVNLREIFTDKVVSADPSFYVHVPTVTDPSLAPPGKDILYILIPVPNLDGNRQDIREREEELRRGVFKKIEAAAGVKLDDLIETEHRFYPQDYITRYNLKYAATFGLAHNLLQSAFFRPVNYDTRIKGLYYVGASTQPGGGLPPVLAGSKIVADLISGKA